MASCLYVLTHSLTHSLTHLPAYLPTHLLTYVRTCRPAKSGQRDAGGQDLSGDLSNMVSTANGSTAVTIGACVGAAIVVGLVLLLLRRCIRRAAHFGVPHISANLRRSKVHPRRSDQDGGAVGSSTSRRSFLGGLRMSIKRSMRGSVLENIASTLRPSQPEARASILEAQAVAERQDREEAWTECNDAAAAASEEATLRKATGSTPGQVHAMGTVSSGEAEGNEEREE